MLGTLLPEIPVSFYFHLSETAVFAYKVDNLYCKEAEFGIRYNDEQIGVDWKIPANKVITSEKDQMAGKLADLVV